MGADDVGPCHGGVLGRVVREPVYVHMTALWALARLSLLAAAVELNRTECYLGRRKPAFLLPIHQRNVLVEELELIGRTSAAATHNRATRQGALVTHHICTPQTPAFYVQISADELMSTHS